MDILLRAKLIKLGGKSGSPSKLRQSWSYFKDQANRDLGRTTPSAFDLADEGVKHWTADENVYGGSAPGGAKDRLTGISDDSGWAQKEDFKADYKKLRGKSPGKIRTKLMGLFYPSMKKTREGHSAMTGRMSFNGKASWKRKNLLGFDKRDRDVGRTNGALFQMIPKEKQKKLLRRLSAILAKRAVIKQMGSASHASYQDRNIKKWQKKWRKASSDNPVVFRVKSRGGPTLREAGKSSYRSADVLDSRKFDRGGHPRSSVNRKTGDWVGSSRVHSSEFKPKKKSKLEKALLRLERAIN